jgi:murein DD-endopeptidase MepM/ murein hydrolase activator NlpD
VQTKNQESNYQKLIAQKQAAEKAFEQELINLQSQLNLIVNPKLLPKVGSGVLSWPFSNAFMFNCMERKKVFGNIFCITQYFGNTSFSTANPQIYNGKGHNAIDIAALDGTPVRAALAGVVLGVGDTDQARGCYSFGKWVMVVHGNGLSTLYSHLSSIDVLKGQNVSTGQVVGLSGRTGYATGPHLHFGVYATQGMQIMRLGDFRNGVKTGCATAIMPVATLDAYLNPLSYL